MPSHATVLAPTPSFVESPPPSPPTPLRLPDPRPLAEALARCVGGQQNLAVAILGELLGDPATLAATNTTMDGFHRGGLTQE